MTRREKQKKAQRDWYKRNKKYMHEKQQTQRAELRKWIKEEVLGKSECKECGESHVACLDFHHRDPSQKEIAISNAIDRKWSKQRVLAEIEKCDILCANCHRKYHWNQKHK